MAHEDIRVRQSINSDFPRILDIHREAFGPTEGPEIVELVSALFKDETAEPLLSLVALAEDHLIGHILFTGAVLTEEGIPGTPGTVPEGFTQIPSVSSSILAPLAVLPQAQGQGAGTQLVQSGLDMLRESGTDLVFVLGHPEYYPRFGFVPAEPLGLMAPYPIPPEHQDAWMVRELKEGVIGKVTGTVRCAEALDHREYWVK